MSSVLEALRKQSSPLLQTPNTVWLSSPTTASKGQRWWLLLPLLLIVSALLASWWWHRPSAPLAEPQRVHSEQALSAEVRPYVLGEATRIKAPTLPSTVPVTVPVTAPLTGPQITQNEQQTIDLQQVSPDLLRAFEQAVAEQSQQRGEREQVQTSSVLPAIAELSISMQRQIPSFTYDAHQYSSHDDARSVTFAGLRLREGEVWQGLTIVSITPTHVVLSRQQQAFQQPALEDWTRP